MGKKLTKVKLIERDEYDHHYFEALINKYPKNKAIFDRADRRLGKVFKVSEHFELANRIRLVTGKGEQLDGQYHAKLFKSITSKMSTNIRGYAKDLYDSCKYTDTHSTNVEYAVVTPRAFKTESLTELYAEYSRIKRKDNKKIKWSTSHYCFAELRSWSGAEFFDHYRKVIGRHRLCMDSDTFLTLVEAARKEGWLSKKTKVWLEPDEADGHRVHYSVPFEEPYNTSYYYFQLSFLRMAREYSGTLRVAYELMQKFNISFTLAMVVSYTENHNRYSLHIAYPPSDNIPVVATACAIREYLGLLRDPEKEKDAWGYNTTDSIEKIARDNNNTRKECQEFLSGNNYKQLNKLVLQEVYNG